MASKKKVALNHRRAGKSSWLRMCTDEHHENVLRIIAQHDISIHSLDMYFGGEVPYDVIKNNCSKETREQLDKEWERFINKATRKIDFKQTEEYITKKGEQHESE